MGNLTEYIKTAFEHKQAGDYKAAIDYFYKALTIENDSCEIMSELAELYTLLSQDGRALSFYEQIIAKNNHNNEICYKYAFLLKKLKRFDEAKEVFLTLFQDEYELSQVAKELFDIYVINQQYQELINTFNLKYNKLSDSFVFYYVGLAYEKLGRQQLAEDFFHKSYDFAKDNVKAGISIVGLLFDNEKYDEAKELAENLLHLSENDRLFYYLAEVSFMKSDFDSAMEQYSYAIKLNDKCALYFFKLGLTYTMKGYYKEAEQSYCNALIIEPDNLTYNYALAYLYYTDKKYLLSLKLVDSILEKDENFVLANALKILLEIHYDRVIFCGDYVQKILDGAEKEDFAFYALSKYYDKLAMWKKALKYIEKAIDLNEKSIEYKIEHAQYLSNLGEVDESIKILKGIIELKPKYLLAYILIAENYIKKEDYIISYDYAKLALQLDINSSEAQFIMGIINYKTCAYEKAIDNFKISVLIAPMAVKNYSYIAECYYKLNMYQEAFAYYKEASLIDVSEASYFYYMAKCSIAMGNIENALSNFSIMYRLSPFNAKYLCDYAEYLGLNKKKNLALSILKKGLKSIKELQDRQKIEECIKKVKKSS